jgi:hypothetical protein
LLEQPLDLNVEDRSRCVLSQNVKNAQLIVSKVSVDDGIAKLDLGYGTRPFQDCIQEVDRDVGSRWMTDDLFKTIVDRGIDFDRFI